MRAVLVATVLLLSAVQAWGAEFATHIPMSNRGASTFYISGHIQGYGEAQFLVDTGAGYTTINESALEELKANGNAEYIKDLRGVMADGSRMVVPLYRLSALHIGGKCEIHNVEAAVFPAKTRFILGMNALREISPFVFSMNPPALRIDHC